MKPTFRCSELDRVLSCNGSITLTPLVDPREGDEGWEGTMVHWMIADRCIRELGAIPPEGGLPPPDVPRGYVLPQNARWMVDWAIYHVQETIPADWSLMVEVGFAYEFDRWILSGHIDLLAISPDGTQSRAIDWKTGRDPVDPADNNEQVAGYIVLQKRAWDELNRCVFQICQPRVSEDDGFERVSTVIVDTLPELVLSLDQRICTAMGNAMKLKTGKQCKYCIGCSCPAIQAEQEFMELTMTPEMLAKIKKTPDDALLADFVIIGNRLEKPLKDAKELLHKRLDVNPVIDAGSGIRVTRKIEGGSYTIPDEKKFFEQVKELLPSEDSIAKVMKPSMTRIKDELAAVMQIPKTGQAAVTAETVFDAKLRPLTEQSERRLLIFS